MPTPGSFGIAVRLWCWAALLRPLKHVLPLARLVRLVHARGRAAFRSPEFERRLERYMTADGRFPRRPPGNCLERSLGAYRLLCAANAAPTLIVGLRRSGTADIVQGHVWIVVDGRAFAEPPERLSTYTTLLTFDPDARQHAVSGATGRLQGVSSA